MLYNWQLDLPHVCGKKVDHDAQQHTDSQSAERFEQARQYEILHSIFHEVQSCGRNSGYEQAHH